MYLKNGPAGYTSLKHRRSYLDPHNLGSFRAHYDACRNATDSPKSPNSLYSSVYDLLLDKTLLHLNVDYDHLVESISQKVSHKFQYNISCSQQTELTNLNTWPDIYEVRQLAEYIIPQIEELVYSSWVRVESANIYRSIPFTQLSPLSSSWQWHYDSCPDEATKIMIYLSDVTLDDGPMQFLTGPTRSVPKYFSSRINQEYTDTWQMMFNDGDRIPTNVIDNCISADCKLSSLTGPRGTYALFSPNQPHRATMPLATGQTWRDVLVFHLRPALSNNSWYNREIGLRPIGDPKTYSLD